MSDQINYKLFDATSVNLEGSNLIEASAGTGKTYSIAILVLRLLIEKKIPIKEILMVTFTRAAVAELEERIRYFVRSAYKSSLGKKINDENIRNIVQLAIDQSGVEPIQRQLKDAVLFLDEISVLTIHSFCQQTLNEFAFETNQLFGAEMIPDIKSVIEEELNKSWRNHVTTLPVPLLKIIWTEEMKGSIKKAIEEHLDGKQYFGYDDSVNYLINKDVHDEWISSIESLKNKGAEMRAALEEYVSDNKDQIIKTTTDKKAIRYALPHIESPDKFLNYIWGKKKESAYISTSFPDLLERLQSCDDCSKELDQIIQTIVSHINYLVIQEVSVGVTIFKLRNNLLGYDDMVSNLHKAIWEKDNPALVNALQKKYKAVFVDEFQDTDRQQFEIFDKAFGKNTILFYIGDPKQSIYAWRKADIFTYFKARNSVQYVYGMNHNYRSAASLIVAMNQFFLPIVDFDTFYFRDEEDTIFYHPVESPVPNTKGELLKDNKPDAPISIFKVDSKDQVHEVLAAQVAALLHDNSYSIRVKNETRKIQPSDIGILVRTAKEGKSAKAALSRIGIPAVTIDESKVLQSQEARQVLYLMEAIASPDRSTINRALLSPFTGLDNNAILLLDDEITLGLFNKYKIKWQQDGIYTALMEFVSDFAVRKILQDQSNESGERIITNMFQIIELLHQMQSRKNLSIPELISWLKRGIDGMITEGDEYSQRVESDEEAVKIVTIHKSKGLEYNIVMGPYLDFVPQVQNSFASFRSPDSGNYFAVEKKRLTASQKELYDKQTEQEYRRLLYVAVTRAVYKCFIIRNQSNYTAKSTLLTFINAINDNEAGLIVFEKELPVQQLRFAKPIDTRESTLIAEPVNFNLLQQNWRKMSYTMLAAKGDITPRARPQKNDDAYETFILHTLRRGSKTGNLLHYIFENINFSDQSYWERLLEEAIRRFVPGQREVYLPMLRLMLEQVFTTAININNTRFSLADVDYYKRIPEFEFDFPVTEFAPDMLNDLSDELSNINVKGFHELNTKQLEGIMNGKMDLFFEHLGRYYILDWKSNYLGPIAEDYSPRSLALAMNESNYHLQYLIYTVAAKKYLETRLTSFDYETQFGGVIYLFVRGMRYGTDAGIFTTKPAVERINKLEQLLTASVNIHSK